MNVVVLLLLPVCLLCQRRRRRCATHIACHHEKPESNIDAALKYAPLRRLTSPLCVLLHPAGKKAMGNVDQFLKSLLAFDKDNVPVNCVDAVERDFISQPTFTPDNIRSKSSAAAGLCAWVVNICKYFRIYQVSGMGSHDGVALP